MDDRLTDVEIKLAYAERRIDDLDDIVRSLADTVDLLTKELARQRRELTQEDLPPGNVKPPHY